MNVTAIIAEYNPFHNGHAYQLKLARQKTNADYLIIVMSGNFVQRGAPAVFDKYVRAAMALNEGADLILELPTLWATASAEFFAGGSIAILNHLNCIKTLCYGCETPNKTLFSKIIHILCAEPPVYRNMLSRLQKNGISFPKARNNALLSCLPDSDIESASTVFCQPNNILALEYEKALASSHSDIKSLPLQRKGQGYHAEAIPTNVEMASATAIRNNLLNHTLADIQPFLPESCFPLVLEQPAYLSEDDFSQILHYALLQHFEDGYEKFADCMPALSDKIKKHLDSYQSFSDFVRILKSKDLTQTRIQRCLFHIILNLQKSSYVEWKSNGYVPYLRVLGFRKDAARLLKELKKNADLPIIIRLSDLKKLLHSQEQLSFQKQQEFADRTYQAIWTARTGQICSEYQKPLLTI